MLRAQNEPQMRRLKYSSPRSRWRSANTASEKASLLLYGDSNFEVINQFGCTNLLFSTYRALLIVLTM